MLDQAANRIAARGQEALVAELRAGVEELVVHRGIPPGPEELELLVQRAADLADGLQWRRALAKVATEELSIALADALDHPAVARAQAIVGAPSYEGSRASTAAGRVLGPSGHEAAGHASFDPGAPEMRDIEKARDEEAAGVRGTEREQEDDEAGASQTPPMASLSDASVGVPSATASRRRPLTNLGRIRSQPYGASTSVLCIGLLLQPAWSQAPIRTLGFLTFGRVILITVTLAVIGELLVRRSWFELLPAPSVLLVGGLISGAVVVAISAHQHGTTRTGGAFYGYVEFVVTVTLLLVVSSLNERSHFPLLLAAAGGSLLSDVQALAVGATYDATTRLSGTFGNPNYLAYATATGAAILLAAQRVIRGWWRPVGLLLLLPAFAALVLTYSRTGAVILAASVLALSGLWTPSKRRVVVVAAVAIAMSAGAILAYPVFQRLRTNSDVPAHLPRIDRSGWDPSAQGPISGHSKLANHRGGGLQVSTDTPASGVSLAIGVVRAGVQVKAIVAATSGTRRLPFRLALEDNIRGNHLVEALSYLGPSPRRLTLRWRPRADSPAARVYMWSPASHARFVIRRLVITKTGFSRASRLAGKSESVTETPPARLLGLIANPFATAFERRSVASRQKVTTFAIELFLHHALFGVGWERFDAYAAPKLGVYDPGSAHDQFLTIAADLGVPGILCVLLCGLGLALRLRRGRFTPVQTVALAASTGALVGLLFIDAAVTPAVVLPLATSVAVLFAQRRPMPRRRD